ncbi:MAG: DUF479 domain-containing protein [Rhodocyclaceae bacterium]|nr:DUF479 domain-containing protein [Rhodocyclaceae bacterium]
MNYLAHALLAGPDPESRLGGLLGDFVKGTPDGFDPRLPPGVVAGIALHRQIDRYADTHPAFQASRRRVSAQRRRYAGVMIDMFYDHFLARHWLRYCSQPLGEFAEETYALLADHAAILPPRLRGMLPHMREQNWLVSYACAAGIGTALDGISRHRLTRPNPLAGGVDELLSGYGGFEADFDTFMAAAVAFAHDWRAKAGANR